MPAVSPTSEPAVAMETPFNVDFNVSAHDGRLWIKPLWGDRDSEQELRLKGVNWFGASGTRFCMEEINSISVQRYIDFMVEHEFNAVRLPLNGGTVLRNPTLDGNQWNGCGEYAGYSYLDMLAHVSQRLAGAGIFLMLDVHSMVEPEQNQPLWCEPGDGGAGCADGVDDDALSQPDSIQPLLRVWEILAERLCSHRNVIMADLYNEPFGAHWGNHTVPPRTRAEMQHPWTADPSWARGTDWAAAAQRLGNHVLSLCERWLIVVQGVANNEPTHICMNVTDGAGWCWWGENVLGQVTNPIRLEQPDRLVLSPHSYGHGSQPCARSPQPYTYTRTGPHGTPSCSVRGPHTD